MLKVKDLVKIYKIGKTRETVKALDKVSIDFPEKGLVFLLGKSGSGKSTLLNAIGGLDTFDSGEIIIKGKSSKDFKQSDFDSYRNTFIGFIFQEYNVLEEFTVAKNLAIALELQGKPADKEAVNNLLQQVDMLEFARRKPNQLSGGQKQRVAIARALIKNPEIIMADEPTGALDSNTGKQVMDTLKKLSQEKLVIIVSHDREFAEIYGDRIIELKDGKIIQDVTKKEIESTKTQSGVSLIDNKLIHIKKGIELTNDDLNKIASILKNQSSQSDVIISIDDKANEQVKKANFITENGNKETFLPTTEEDTIQKEYDPRKFKLIKSKLKFKDSFKMGASALKNKVGKLVFTIFLSFIAFAMFGIIDTLSAFNRAEGVYNTITMSNTKHVSIKKEKKGEYSNYNEPIKKSDLDYFKENFPDINYEIVVGRNLNFGESWSSNNNSIQINGLDYYSNNPVYTANHSGFISINQEKLTNLGFTLSAGNLPVNDNEICISEHLYNCFKKNNDTEIINMEQFLSNYSQCSLNSNSGTGGSYKIVGIIKDNTDISKYTQMTTEEINSNYTLRSEIDTVFGYGYSNILYTTESKYNELLEGAISVSLAIRPTENGSYWTTRVGTDLYNISSYADNYYYSWHFDQFNNYFTLKNNQPAMYSQSSYFDCGTNGIIVDYNIAYSVLQNYKSENNLFDSSLEVNEAIGNGLLKFYATNDDKSITPIELTIVGVQTYNYSYMFANPSLKQTFANTQSIKIYLSEDTSETPLQTLEKDNLQTLQETFSICNPINLDLTYFKGNTKPKYEDITLTGKEAIVPSYYLSDLGTEEELIEKIENGTLKLPILNGSNSSADELVSLTIVGLSYTSNGIIVSDDLYDSMFKPFTFGYEYIIATLSDNEKQNKDFIKYCETYHNDMVFPVQNASTAILDNFSEIFNTVTEVFFYVGIGFAVFAALLLMNFISTSISYKKREIGILRALGARGSDVFGIFFNESLVIAGINFTLATITTIVTCGILNNVIIKKLGLNLVLLSVGIRQIALMLLISVGVAFLASLIPVSKIAKKKPIDAINNR